MIARRLLSSMDLHMTRPKTRILSHRIIEEDTLRLWYPDYYCSTGCVARRSLIRQPKKLSECINTRDFGTLPLG
jgi:hypothetical protein